ncbi:MAG TPA: flavin reductase family protein [Thermomicrobiales bacterium]|nr:flavin reductase family protein [Thermomicrobiales bacterium]
MNDLPAVDSAAFRRAVGQFATGVTVITVTHGDHVHGMTANSFTSVSLDPPLVLFCVGKSARMARLIEQVEGFAINILSDRQMQVSRQFAGANKEDAARTVRLHRGPVAPLLSGSLVALSCRTSAIHEGGDHWIVVGEVIALHEVGQDRASGPLAFFRSRYCDLIEPPTPVEQADRWSNDEIRIYHEEWSAGDLGEPAERPELPW